jgi:NitT/TauT family transport system substrate-binding protein
MMVKPLLRRVATSAVLWAVLLLFYSPAQAAEAAPERLAISVAVGNAIYWDVFCAVENGFFTEEGFAPEYVTMNSSTNSTQNLVAGAVNLQGGSPEPVLDAVERGAAIGILVAASAKANGPFVVRPEIGGFADLKGKTLGVSAPKGGEMWMLKELLARNGLAAGQYDTIPVGLSPAKFAALARGAIAGAILLEPSGQLAISNGYRLLSDFWVLDTYPYPTYAVTRDWAHADHHGLRAARAIVKGQRWLNDPANHAAAVAILEKTTKQKSAIAEATYQELIESQHFFVADGKVDLKGIARLVGAMSDAGDIKGAPAPAKFMIAPEDGGSSF